MIRGIHLKLTDFRRFVAEVLIIVLGVLIALAVNNWNSNRIDRNLEAQYLVRLMEDLDNRSEVLTFMLSRIDNKIERLGKVDAILRTRSDRPDFFQDLVTALRNETLVFGWVLPEFQNYTFDELISTGQLGLIRDVGLRTMLIDTDYELTTTIGRIDTRKGDFGPYVYSLIPPEYGLYYSDPEVDLAPLDTMIDPVTQAILSAAIEEGDFQRKLNVERNYAAFIKDILGSLEPELEELRQVLLQVVSEN